MVADIAADALTIATLNTWKNDGEYWKRLPAMARAVAGVRPDVVFLQEVLRAPGAEDADTAATIAEAAGLKASTEKARRRKREIDGRRVDCWSGMSILHRRRLDLYRLDLPVNERHDGERMALFAEIDTPVGPVTLVNLHLTHPPEETDMRRAEMQVVLDELERREVDRAILAGDFNDGPDSSALDLCRSQRWRCRNVVEEAHEGGFFPTFPETGLTVDHILLLEPTWADHAEVRLAGPFADSPDPETGVMPSDHLGVCAVVSF